MRLSSESQEIRPYVGVAELQSVFRDVRLIVGNTAVVPWGRAQLSPRAFVRERVALALASDDEGTRILAKRLDEALESSGLSADSVSLVLVASTSRLKITDIVWRLPLDELNHLQPLVPIANGPDRPAPLQAPFGACSIILYLVLDRQLPEAPLRPWRKGTWLARTQFTVASELSEFGFTPIPLDDVERQRLGLGPDVLRFVQVDSPLEPAGIHDSVLVYLDHEILTAVSEAPYSSAARAFQAQLLLDVVNGIVREASRQLRDQPGHETLDDIEGSVLWHLLRRAAVAANPPTPEELRSMQRLLGTVADRPELFLAQVEGWVPDLRSHLTAAIQGRN